MHIVTLDPATVTDADAAELHALVAAVATADRPHDPAPAAADVAFRLRHADRPDRRMVYLVARTAGEAVGYASIWLSLLDNLAMGLADIRVHPGHRRRGIGTALLGTVLAELTAGGRTILLGETDAGGPGDGFARAFGARIVETDRLSLLRLADVDWPAVDTAATAPHPGYRLAVHHRPDPGPPARVVRTGQDRDERRPARRDRPGGLRLHRRAAAGRGDRGARAR